MASGAKAKDLLPFCNYETKFTESQLITLTGRHCACSFCLLLGCVSLDLPMSNSSPARRIRKGSIRIGLVAAVITFVSIEGDALQDQLTIGQASMVFMLGTAFVGAGICIGLFGLITAVGLATSVFFSEQPPAQSQKASGVIGPVDYDNTARISPRIQSDTIRRSSVVSKGKRRRVDA